jgi:hypothetical protein
MLREGGGILEASSQCELFRVLDASNTKKTTKARKIAKTRFISFRTRTRTPHQKRLNFAPQQKAERKCEDASFILGFHTGIRALHNTR